MSTRYVYAVYNTTVSSRETVNTIKLSSNSLNAYPVLKAIYCNSYEKGIAYNRNGEPLAFYDTENASRGTVTVTYETPNTAVDHVVDASAYEYVVLLKGTSELTSLSDCLLLERPANSIGYFWHIINYGSGGNYDLGAISSQYSTKFGGEALDQGGEPFYKSGGVISKGSSIVFHQSTALKNLEEGAISYNNNWRWRDYKGQDSIDPSAVTYSKQDLYSGEPVTIIATPITPTYGGAISYQYQYSTDGGTTWTNIGSKTTETSKTFTIPEEVEQFQARVQASDGWGFTSATYVTGANLPVSQIKAYATVSGKLMAGAKMYATVGGKIRQIQKGYATVGGKIRKMF